MRAEDYLNPETLRSQCENIKTKLERDNEALCIASDKINSFISSTSLKADAYDGLRQQMQDYYSVINAMMTANDLDIVDASTLEDVIGDEVLNGAEICTGMKNSLNNAGTYKSISEENKKNALLTPALYFYFELRAYYYSKLSENAEAEYEVWKKKAQKFDLISDSTSGLFNSSASIRQCADKGLEEMGKAFKCGKFLCNSDYSWRTQLSLELESVSDSCRERISENLLKSYGYTEEEIKALSGQGVYINNSDIVKLKNTEENDNVYISHDEKALLFHGKVYYVHVPDNAHQSIDAVWNLDGTKTAWDCKLYGSVEDLVESISDTELPEKEKIVTSDSFGRRTLQSENYSLNDNYTNDNAAIYGSLAMAGVALVSNFITENMDSTKVNISFYSSGKDSECRRAVISVINFQENNKFQNYGYNIYTGTHHINTITQNNDYTSKRLASSVAEAVYQAVTGKEPPEADKYTLVGEIDEQHANNDVNGYLSYSDEGQLLYTPNVYPKDRAYVYSTTITSFWGEGTEILDFTDKLGTPSVCDETTQTIFENALQGVYDEK